MPKRKRPTPAPRAPLNPVYNPGDQLLLDGAIYVVKASIPFGTNNPAYSDLAAEERADDRQQRIWQRRQERLKKMLHPEAGDVS